MDKEIIYIFIFS